MSAATYEAGQVFRATVRGLPGQIVMATGGPDRNRYAWVTPRAIDGRTYHRDEHVGDLEPQAYVTVAREDEDVDDAAAILATADLLDKVAERVGLTVTVTQKAARRCSRLAERLRAGATPAVVKPVEPLTIGSVVVDASGVRWVRMGDRPADAEIWRMAQAEAVGADVGRTWVGIDVVSIERA